MSQRFAALAIVFLIASASASAIVGYASAVTPTPTPAASTPPPPADAFTILVFNDLNNNEILDPGEPGLADWNITQGCSDAVQLLTTDANGEVATQAFGAEVCLHVTRPFGWLPTHNNINVRMPADCESLPGATCWDAAEPFLFGFHDLGRTVMELHGEAITGGLPAEQGNPGVVEPFRDCGHLMFEHVSSIGTFTVVIVEGADTRVGCPRRGESIQPSSDAVPPTPFPPLPFAPGTTALTTWLAHGDSMRLISQDITDAWVFDAATGSLTKDCAEARVVGGFVPPGTVRVFVLSEEARRGCGAIGRTVRLFRNGVPLAPVIQWRAGDVSETLPQFELAPATDPQIFPPETGSAGLQDQRNTRSYANRATTSSFSRW